MYKLSSLFSNKQMFDRKNAEQERFELAFTEEIPLFIRVIDNAFEMMRMHRSSIPPISRGRNLSAVLVNGFIRGELYQTFPDRIRTDHTGRFYLTKNGAWRVYFKKLNPKTLLPENVETTHVKMINNQLTLSLDDYSPIIFIGYTVTRTWDALTGCYAIYTKDEKIVWKSSLTDICYETSEHKIEIPDVKISVPETSIIRKRSI